MDAIGFEQPLWKPFKFLGFDHDALAVNATTVGNTWIALILIVCLIIICRFLLRTKRSAGYFIVIAGIRSLMNLTIQAFGTFHYHYFAFATSLFIFILTCNWIILLPGTSEPTKDLNTAFALGIIALIYKDFETIRVHGFSGYVHEFLEPFFLMFPVNFIGHFSKVISMSFRLFGNIFGGSIIMELYRHALSYSIFFQLLGLFSGVNFIVILFFGIFEGFIQAFIFSMLTTTYLALALQKEPSVES